MLEGAASAVVVSNAQPDLLHWAEQQSRDAMILASKPRAWGILEGLAQLGCA